MTTTYTVQRGAAAGTILTPHRHADGKYVASPDRFKESYHRLDTADEAIAFAKAKGWSIRMSAKGRAPSLISSAKI